MRRFALLCLAALWAYVLSGCIQVETVVVVAPDGSGTVEITQRVGPETIKMMKEMAQSFGGGGEQNDEMFKEEEMKEAAADMGEGVAFVSSTKVAEDGFEGRKGIYSFTDLNKLRLESKPSGPGDKNRDAEELSFRFEKQAGGNARVTVLIPQKEAAGADSGEATHPEDAKQAEKEPTAAEMAQAKKMLQGLRFGVAVRVDGTLVKTNSPHVDGNTVTIFEMDFGAVVENAEKLKELQKKEPETLEAMQAILQGIPGIKLPPGPEVTVEFAGK